MKKISSWIGWLLGLALGFGPNLGWTQQATNGALHFSGLGSRMALKPLSLPVPWTIELWVRRQDAPGPSAPLFINQTGALKLEQFGAGRRVGFSVFGQKDYAFDYAAPAGEWVHLAIVAGAGGTDLLVNGRLVQSLPQTMDLPLDYFGSLPSTPAEQLVGDIDELRVWRIYRNYAQIEASMRGALAGDEPGLVAYLRCDTDRGGLTSDSAAANWVGVGILAGVTVLPSSMPLWPGFEFSRRSLFVPENGRMTLGIHLTRPPASNLVASVRRLSGDTDLNVAVPAVLNFSSTNWQDDQWVTISAAADADSVDGEATFTVEALGAISRNFQAHELDVNLSAAVQLHMLQVPVVQLAGPAYAAYTLEFATDPADPASWQFLANTVVTNDASYFVDWDSMGKSRRFYRAALQPFRAPTNMVYLAPGSFTMGSPFDEPERIDVEDPHKVILTQGFWIGRYEVTQDEYYRVMGSRPSRHVGGDLPVERVSWDEAREYCALLTEQERLAGRVPRGWAYRLPSEAEWEYACRAGKQTAFGFGPKLLSGMANLNGQYGYDAAVGTVENPQGVNLQQTTPVGSYAPNAWGLYDMHGNVHEWCLDGDLPYPTHTVTDPVASSPGDRGRIIRGGSIYYTAVWARAAVRVATRQDYQSPDVGFRVVLAPER